jgi:hypothetical protein
MLLSGPVRSKHVCCGSNAPGSSTLIVDAAESDAPPISRPFPRMRLEYRGESRGALVLCCLPPLDTGMMALMRIALLTAVAALIAPAVSHAQMKKAQDIVWGCDHLEGRQTFEQLANYASCSGYVQGANDLMALVFPPEQGKYCPPIEGISVDQAVRIVLKWIEAHPEDMHQPARLAVVLALLQTFPCKPHGPK